MLSDQQESPGGRSSGSLEIATPMSCLDPSSHLPRFGVRLGVTPLASAAVTRKLTANRLSVCNHHTDPSHKHPTKGAHKPIAGFDPGDVATMGKYAKSATAEQLAKLLAAPTSTGAGPSQKGRVQSRAVEKAVVC